MTAHTDDPSKAKNFNWQVIMGREKYRDYKGLMNNYGAKWMEEITNMRNAEFHYPNRIEINRLERVIFRSNAELKFAQVELQNKTEVPMYVDEKKFTFLKKHNEAQRKKEYDINFLNDYFIKVHEVKNDVELMLAYSIEGYKHSLRIEQEGRRKPVVLNLLMPEGDEVIVYHT